MQVLVHPNLIPWTFSSPVIVAAIAAIADKLVTDTPESVVLLGRRPTRKVLVDENERNKGKPTPRRIQNLYGYRYLLDLNGN